MLRSTRIRAAVTAAALLVPPMYSAAAAPSASTLPDILLSRQLAEQASLRVGDTVTFAAEADGKDAKQFRVAGIYEPTPDPMRFTSRRIEARVHLPDLLAMTARPDDPSSADSVRAMNVKLVDPKEGDAFSAALSARIPGTFSRPTARAQDGSDPFAVLERFHLAVAIVTVLGSTAFLLALMVMRAEERREIVGIIRLIGVSQRFVLLMVLAEGSADRGRWRDLRRPRRARGRRERQPLLPVALRHHARLRPRHRADRAAVGRARRPARHPRRAGRLLDAAPARHRLAGSPMSAWSLAWRTVAHNPARACLAIGGVAVIGALLFDMLLLSQGLLLSFRDLLDTAGYDVRVLANEGSPIHRAPLPGAPSLADEIARLPEVRRVALIRSDTALATAPGREANAASVTAHREQRTRDRRRVGAGQRVAAALFVRARRAGAARRQHEAGASCSSSSQDRCCASASRSGAPPPSCPRSTAASSASATSPSRPQTTTPWPRRWRDLRRRTGRRKERTKPT